MSRIKKIKRNKRWYNFSTADGLAIFGIIITIVFSVIAYNLNREQIRLSNIQIDIAKSQTYLQKQANETSIAITHFDTLLRETDTLIDKISSQIGIQDSLLSVNLNELAISKEYSKLNQRAAINRLFNANRELSLLLFGIIETNYNKLNEWKQQDRLVFLSNVKNILESQENNTFLLSNADAYFDWISLWDSVSSTEFNIHFFQLKQNYGNLTYEQAQSMVTKEWFNCVSTLGGLNMSMNDFFNCYQWDRKKNIDQKFPKYLSRKDLLTKLKHRNRKKI